MFKYPCIGQFRFLELSIGNHPLYQEISKRMNSGSQRYLDLGCCFAQDLRRLVFDGAPSENCYGSDLELEFMEIGYDLFRDRDTLKSKLISCDVFAPNKKLDALEGKIDIIHAASFFHLFTWDEQVTIGHLVVKLLKQQKNSLIVGRHVGYVKGRVLPSTSRPNKAIFRHDNDTWKKLWKQIGDETGTEWEADSSLEDWRLRFGKDQTYREDGAMRMIFSVRRL